MALGLGAAFAGGSLALVGSYLGLGLLLAGLATTMAAGVWLIRSWDYYGS